MGTLVVFTSVLPWAGEDVTVFAADEEAAGAGGAVQVLSDMAGLAATVLGLVESDGLAFSVVVIVVAVVGEDAEVGFGEAVSGLVAVAETFWGAGVDVTVGEAEVATSGADVEDDRAEVSFTAVVSVGTGLTVVVTAGVTFTVFDVTFGAAGTAVAATDAGTALTATGGDDTADGAVAAGVAAVVLLAESGPGVFTGVETEGFGSVGALEAVCVGFTPGGVDVTVLAGGSGVVVVGVAVTAADVVSVTEDAEETWVNAVSKLWAVAGADVLAAIGWGGVT